MEKRERELETYVSALLSLYYQLLKNSFKELFCFAKSFETKKAFIQLINKAFGYA